MQREDVIQLARESGLYLDGENKRHPLYVITPDELEAFATAVEQRTLYATLERAAQESDGRSAPCY